MWLSPTITGTHICQVFGISRWTLTEYRQRLGLAPRSQRQNPREYLPITEFERRLEQMRAGYDRYVLLRQEPTPEITASLFACPQCGMRAASQQGHAQCQQEAAA
jgi:hypothetical protein